MNITHTSNGVKIRSLAETAPPGAPSAAHRIAAVGGLVLAFACAGGALAQIADGPNFFRHAAHVWNSGVHNGPGLAAPVENVQGELVEQRPVRLRQREGLDAENPALAGADRPLLRPADAALVAEHVVAEPGVAWTQIHFDDYDLGRRSFLILTSLLDGDQQRLDAKSLPKWNDASGYFHGDSVRVQLYAAPGDEGVFASVGGLIVREPNNGFVPFSLCDGDDDRVPTTDARVGRIAFSTTSAGRFCTAWLVSNGAVLTAGHCLDGGSGDGVLDVGAGAVVEFNVPSSTSGGTPVPADLDDQYPIDLNSVDWSSEGVSGGNTIGDDWAVFELDANANTGLRAHVANGFFRMSRSTPSIDATIRISGYGDDSTPSAERHRTLQTDVGPYKGESSTTNGIRHTYRADTENSNSGSPVIWNTPGVTIGIHTNAGCGDSGGANQGTSFENDDLENQIDDLPAFGAVHVDAGHPEGENGTVFFPYDQFVEGVNATSAGGVLSVVEGFYNETTLITKAMRIEAPVGSVVIGN